MTKPIQDMTSWGPSGAVPLDSRTSPSTAASSSHFAARSSMSADDELPSAPTDIGRRVGHTLWEMSVVCEPAEALSLQFDVLQPLFLAVHDIGGTTSRRLLAGVAAAMQLPVHTLNIRRQGYGNMLARLEFVELSSSDGSHRTSPSVRIYSTQSPDTEEAARQHLAEVLLGRAGLAVAIIDGDLSPAALAVSLAGLQSAMGEATWTNRHTLLMPLRPMPTLKAQAAQLGRDREIDVSVTPPIVRPFDAWNAVRTRWNELAQLGESTMLPLDDPTSPLGRRPPPRPPSRDETAAAVEALRRKLVSQRERASQPAASPNEAHLDAAAKTIASMSKREVTLVGAAATAAATPVKAREDARPRVAPAAEVKAVMPSQDDAPTVPAPLMSVDGRQAGDAMRSHPAATAATEGPLHDLVTQAMGVAGMLRCAVVDLETRAVLAEQAVVDPKAFGGHAVRLAHTLRAAAMGFQVPGRIPDAAMTFDEHHVLLRPVPGQNHLALVAILGSEDANVVVAKLKLQRIEKALFPEAGADRAATPAV